MTCFHLSGRGLLRSGLLLSTCTMVSLAAVTSAYAQAPADIVVHAASAVDVQGSWRKVVDSGAAAGERLWQPSAGAAKIAQASATPQHYFDVRFNAESGRPYRLWVRAKAENNHYLNDSVYAQFSDSVTADGAPVYRIGTASAATVIREDCTNCAFSGWGWQDNEYGNLALGPDIRFAESGLHTIRIQAREDGISVDQIVLSSSAWFTSPPGAKDNDTTIHPETEADGAASSGTMAFTQQRYAVGAFDGVAAVDLNGDAKPDVAGAYFSGMEVHSALNGGSRTFRSAYGAEKWTSAATPSRVIGGDFTGDGKADLLALDTFWNLAAVFPGDGAGGFSQSILTNFDERTMDVAAADFTGDGILDLVAAEADTGNVAVRAGDGLGRFSFVSFTPACAGPAEVVAADFNGDGRHDAAARCAGDGTVRILNGDGTGRFAGGSSINVEALALGAANLDGDRYADLVVGWGTWVALVLYGSAEGLTSGVSYQTSEMPGARIVPRGIAFGDMNGDGQIDLVVTHRNSSSIAMMSTFAVVPSTGSRTFGAPEDFAKFGHEPAVVADMDGDGRLDVISPESNVGFSIHWNDPAAANRPPVANAGSDATIMDADQADFRLDARGSSDPDGHAILYEWVSSDGRRLWGPTPYAFEHGGYAPGTYTFTLTTDDLQGATSSDSVTVTIQRAAPEGNRAPVADAEVSLSGDWPYEMQFQDMPDPQTSMFSRSTDPDGDTLTYEWRNAAGEVISVSQSWDTNTAPPLRPGTHSFTLTVRDGRGGESSDTVSVTVTNYEEIVMVGAGYKEQVVGTAWEEAEDPAGSSHYVVRSIDFGAPKVTAPLASPDSYVDISFVADPTVEYKLWIRLKAKDNYWGNDSVWVQFAGAADAAGNPVFRTGTSSGLWVNLEECAGCGISGWGWRDDAWGAPGAMSSTYLRFPQGGVQSLRIQVREDGTSIDTIVLSARKYKTTRPGAVKNDATQLVFNAYWGT